MPALKSGIDGDNMNPSTKWFPQAETLNAHMLNGRQPAAASGHGIRASGQSFGFVTVWELTSALADSPSAADDNTPCRTA